MFLPSFYTDNEYVPNSGTEIEYVIFTVYLIKHVCVNININSHNRSV